MSHATDIQYGVIIYGVMQDNYSSIDREETRDCNHRVRIQGALIMSHNYAKSENNNMSLKSCAFPSYSIMHAYTVNLRI